MKQEKIPPRPSGGSKERPAFSDYVPVPLRARHDGWTPDRQLDFIEALAASGCVTEAAKAVGLSTAAAYKLRARPDAQAFRLAWDAAVDFAMARLVDAALGRAIHGVPVPIFHQGEQVGERREFDERLAMRQAAAMLGVDLDLFLPPGAAAAAKREDAAGRDNDADPNG